MTSRVTVADLARHLQLSAATVGHVLNGRGSELRIRPETQERVLSAARELGYRPNAFARAMSTGRFGTAALVQPLHGVYMPHSLVLGLTEELYKNDMSLTISEAPDSALSEAEFLPKVVRELAADGLLINIVRPIPPRLVEALRKLSTPAVWINNKQPFDAAHPDDLLAGRIATEHLLKLGHRHIAFVAAGIETNAEVHYSIGDRLQGYKQAMQAAGLQPEVFDWPRLPSTWEDLRRDTRISSAVQLLSSPQAPTAIVAYSTAIVLPLLQAAERLGFHIPRDISLVVFAEGPDQHIGRAMTTVCTNIQMAAREAVRMLVQKIDMPSEYVESRATPPWFFDGDTCASPRVKR